MRTDLLKRILAVPTCSRREHRMVEFLLQHVRERGAERCGVATVDRWNNVLIVKGSGGDVPCAGAHIDTIQGWDEIEIVEQDGLLLGFDGQGNRRGTGGDDKYGVAVCLELLERFQHIVVALFAREEIGYVGAQNADAGFFGRVGYALEFDAPATGLISYSAGGLRLFENAGQFIQTAMPVLRRFGFTHFQSHPFTDLTGHRRRFTFSCINASCGYHDWHRDDEYVSVAEVETTIEMATELIAALGNRRYDFDASKPDTAKPPVEVTGLALPVMSKQPKKTLCTRS